MTKIGYGESTHRCNIAVCVVIDERRARNKQKQKNPNVLQFSLTLHNGLLTDKLSENTTNAPNIDGGRIPRFPKK